MESHPNLNKRLERRIRSFVQELYLANSNLHGFNTIQQFIVSSIPWGRKWKRCITFLIFNFTLTWNTQSFENVRQKLFIVSFTLYLKSCSISTDFVFHIRSEYIQQKQHTQPYFSFIVKVKNYRKSRTQIAAM